MTLLELALTHRPESHGRGEDWLAHARRLWTSEGEYMTALARHMTATGTWFYKPVITDDGVVQDGHHRIVTALAIGWADREIPVAAAGYDPGTSLTSLKETRQCCKFSARDA